MNEPLHLRHISSSDLFWVGNSVIHDQWPTASLKWLFTCSWNAFPSTVNVHQPSGCLTNRMMCSLKFEKLLGSDVSGCVSEVKEQLFVKTMSIKETPSNIPSKNSDITSELPPQNCLLIGWGQRVGSKWGSLELWLYKRHPISQERRRQREWEKGSPNLLLQSAVCLRKKKKNCCAQCLFEGKISASCIL